MPTFFFSASIISKSVSKRAIVALVSNPSNGGAVRRQAHSKESNPLSAIELQELVF